MVEERKLPKWLKIEGITDPVTVTLEMPGGEDSINEAIAKSYIINIFQTIGRMPQFTAKLLPGLNEIYSFTGNRQDVIDAYFSIKVV